MRAGASREPSPHQRILSWDELLGRIRVSLRAREASKPQALRAEFSVTVAGIVLVRTQIARKAMAFRGAVTRVGRYSGLQQFGAII